MKVIITDRLFTGKRNVPWDDVERYLKRYVGESIRVISTGDDIVIPSDFPDEYSGSAYTKKLRGAAAKAKANLISDLKSIIQDASDRNYLQNKSPKHAKDAAYGWYRYRIRFGIMVQGESEQFPRINYYMGTLVVRINDRGNELYDIINIKKEASKPLEP